MIGVPKCYAVTSNIVVTSSAALVTTGLTSPIAANQRQKLTFKVPFSVGATGGVRCQVAVPAGGVVYNACITLANTVAPSITTAEQVASAVFTNALANAGNHWLEVDVYVKNGATAGNVDLQMAQNTSDALSLTILEGGFVEVTSF